MVVLKNGIEGNRILGTQPISGIYVKFEGGIVTIKDDKVADLLREHPSFGADFIEVQDASVDPFADTREEIEPTHVISNITYGHSEKSTGTAPKMKMTPQMKKLIEGEALKMIPGILKSNPEILRGIITDMAKDLKNKEEKVDSKEEVKGDKTLEK
jgi:hypothetical protein